MKDGDSAHATVEVKPGCYLIRLQPAPSDPEVLFYEGTFRIVRQENKELRAGGDLYCRLKAKEYPAGYPWTAELYPDAATNSSKYDDPNPSAVPTTDLTRLPEPTKQIPVFARADYRAYLQVKSVQENIPSKGQVTVRFDAHYFEPDARRWPQPGSRMIILTPSDPTAKGIEQYRGDVLDEDSGQKVGTLSLHRVSEHLRRARVLLCAVPGVKPPTEQLIGSAFKDKVGWNLETGVRKIDDSRAQLYRAWTIAELHQTLQEIRAPIGTPDPLADGKAADDALDREWLYYLLCVTDIEGYSRGVMFDTYGGDSRNVPREAAAIGGHWMFPDAELWGEAKGKRLQDLEIVYARVALHELGHAMGLDHNHENQGLMNTTDAIAENAHLQRQRLVKSANEQAVHGILDAIDAKGQFDLTRVKNVKTTQGDAVRSADNQRFPHNIEIQFHAEDRHRLALGPDITVRPGTAYESGGPFFGDAEPPPAEGFVLELTPLLETVPLGAPVRVGLGIRNTSSERRQVPRGLNLGSGAVSGTVTDPAGHTRTFWPLKRSLDADPEQDLDPGQTSAADSLTLLRGAQGALFPMAGDHLITVTVTWERSGKPVSTAGETLVRVSPAVDDAHRALAMGLLNAPDILLNLALGVPVSAEATHVIRAACNNPILKPHFAVILAKQEATPHFKRQPDLLRACGWIEESTVLSGAEIQRLAGLLSRLAPSDLSNAVPEVSRVVAVLVAKVDHLVNCGRIAPADAEILTRAIQSLQSTPPNDIGLPSASVKR